ncbi:MAG: alpha-hydroxy acid oxidase [Spirochaetaceae bacterium]|nr:alpha-hydroxy acid oxidase [Spirochaetaceae bacterium]
MLRTLRSVLRFRRRARTRAERLRAQAANIDDLRSLALRRLPSGVFNYIDGGAEDEVTMRANSAAFRRWNFAPRVLCDVSQVDTSTTLLGRRLPIPLVLAPAGFSRMPDPDGELAVARAAARAGLPYSLSTVATRSIEEVAAAADGCNWFQLYPLRDRDLTRDLVRRAAAAGYQAMMPTVDMAVSGRRERDVRHGFTLPPQIGLGTILDGIRHPGWTWRFIRSEPIVFSNVIGRSAADGNTPVALADFINTQFDPGFSWQDVAWLRGEWQGALVVKGIQTVADARIAADHGCDAIVLSNHGGRQLDGAPPALDLVAPVADAVGDRVAVICDGGVRRGGDIVKALALGAHACMAGRAYLYGLGAGGEAGVDYAIELLAEEMHRTMALIGCTSVAQISRAHVAPA